MAVGELRRSRIWEDSQAVMEVSGAMAAMERVEVMMRRRGMVVLPGWWLCSGYTGLVGLVFYHRGHRGHRGGVRGL